MRRPTCPIRLAEWQDWWHPREQFCRRTVRSWLMLSLSVVCFLSGCTRNEKRADLVIINGPEPESLDPAIVTGQADGRIAGALFEGLTRYNPTNALPSPGLAERWEISPDGKTYIFYLRTNLQWSTGEPLTTEDVVYSWLRVLDPMTGSDYAGQLYYIKNGEEFSTSKISDRNAVGIKALDRYRLQVDLVNPTPFFLDLCAFQTLAVVPRQAIEKHKDRWLLKYPVPVSGAYELVSWRLNDKVRLKKNARYWDAANTQSEVVDLIPCVVATTALNLYETGQADVVWDKELVPIDLIDRLRRRPDFHSFDYLGVYFYRYNVTRKPFDDPRVRKALAMAVDKKRLTEKITKAGEKSTSKFVPPGVVNYASPEGLEYNPEEARRLLAEAGYPGGKGFPRTSYLLNNVKTHEKIAVELQEMWRKNLGIDVELRALEWKVYLRSQAELDYDLSRSSWIGDYNDPNTFLDMFMSNNGNNRTGWKNAEYDRLLREANTTVDLKAREKLLQNAETLLIKDELPIVPLFVYVGLEYYDPKRVTGIFPNIRQEHPVRSIHVKKAAPAVGTMR